MPTPNASEPLTPTVDPALVARFRDDLARLADADRDRIVVALSGGPDSVALLLLAHAALGARCTAATVDHGLRPTARAEADDAARLCASLGIEHVILRGTLRERAGRTANVSARARALRYSLLQGHAEQIDAAWIATAHHADDQLETTLMRLNRGAGVGGLAGVRPSGWRTIRPLLSWRRAELRAIVDAAGIVAADDPSNRDDRYDRARLRMALAEPAWLDAAGIATSTAALAEAEEALAWVTQTLLVERMAEVGDHILLDPAGVPAELIRRMVGACVARLDPAATPDGPGYGRLIEALSAGRPATLGRVLATPGAPWRFALAPPRRTG